MCEPLEPSECRARRMFDQLRPPSAKPLCSSKGTMTGVFSSYAVSIAMLVAPIAPVTLPANSGSLMERV
jgi:hypothetical protein